MTDIIKSTKDGRKPWYQVDISGSVLTVTEDHDGSLDTDISGETVTLPDHGVAGVTPDGELTAGPLEKIPRLRARLAHSAAEGWVGLEFVES